MLLVDKLKTEHRTLWDKVVFHRFVNELGDGTLPSDTFGRYFLQDYVFVNDLVVLTSKGISKAPDKYCPVKLSEAQTICSGAP